MSYRKEHAEHNVQLCEELLKSKKYNDWVITTAFYSALHYVQSKMFPLVNGQTTYKDFSEYYKGLPKPRDSRHLINIDLVCKLLPSIRKNYRALYDSCMNARYQNYQVNNTKANRAKANLDAIKANCC